MKYTLFIITLTLFVSYCISQQLPPYDNCSQHSTLEAKRKCVALQYTLKTTGLGTLDIALRNVTVFGARDSQGKLDVEFCIDVSGCYGPDLVEDYVAVIYIEAEPGIRFTELFGETYPSTFKAEPQVCADDCYSLMYVINATQLNTATGQVSQGDGLFYIGYYRFAPNDYKVLSETTNSLNSGVKFFENSAGNIPPQSACGLIGFACPFNNPLLAQYNSFEDCVDKLSLLQDNPIQCPDVLTSNTTDCRNLHAVTSLAGLNGTSERHCRHTAVPSADDACSDRCLSVCSQCHSNAKCNFRASKKGERLYSCSCKEGYEGDGIQQCQPKTCSARWECGEYNKVDCKQGMCGCQPSFEWNPISGTCDCPSDTNLVWIEGSPICLRIGECTEDWHCSSLHNLGSITNLKCRDYGVNPFTDYKTCVSNYGFEGDGPVPIVCEQGKRIEWNNAIGGNVCLYQDECTADWQCGGNGKVCNFSLGPQQEPSVGVCN